MTTTEEKTEGQGWEMSEQEIAGLTLFGNANPADIGDDPFKIDPDTYKMRIVECELSRKEDGDLKLKVVWQITEPDSEFDESKVTQYHTIVNKPADQMTPKQKKGMRFYKLFLREGIDLTETEMKSLSAQSLLNREAYVTTTVNKDGYNNVHKVLCPRLYKERNADADDLNDSLGIGKTSLTDDI